MSARDSLYWLCAWLSLGVLLIYLLLWEFPRYEWRIFRLNGKYRKEAKKTYTFKKTCRLDLENLLYRLKKATERKKLWKRL